MHETTQQQQNTLAVNNKNRKGCSSNPFMGDPIHDIDYITKRKCICKASHNDSVKDVTSKFVGGSLIRCRL